MSARCVALLSGGLDSMLAIRLMQDQDVEVEALHFQTIFTCCRDDAARAARQLGVRLTAVRQEDDYLDLVRKPRFGYGRAANPCVDCRIYMFQRAKAFMEQIGARFVISGEVVGQRPMSQKRRDLDIIARHSGLEDLLLRPLSAQRLPATLPERQGLVDRDQLMSFSGRSRKGMIALARRLQFPEIPSPSTGCALTEVGFGRKVFDLIEWDPVSQRWDFELLRIGRHYRLDATTKIIVGRNAQDNARLCDAFLRHNTNRATLLEPMGFAAPAVMVIGNSDRPSIDAAIGLMLRHSRPADSDHARIQITRDGDVQHIGLPAATPEADVRSITATSTGRSAIAG